VQRTAGTLWLRQAVSYTRTFFYSRSFVSSRPAAANASRSAIESDTMVPKEPQPVHALRNAQVSTPKRSARKRMATAGNGTAGRKPTSRETTSAVWHSA